MKCPKCKKEISHNTSFCPYCGTLVRRDSEEKPILKRCKKARKMRIILSMLIALSVSGIGFFWILGIINDRYSIFPFFYRQSELLVDLESETVYLPVKEEEESRFTVRALTDMGEIHLCEDKNTVVSEMYDDGTHGDEQAGDNIYTCYIELESEETGTVRYYAKADGETSNSVDIYYFSVPTEEMINEMKSIEGELSEIESGYVDENGYVPDEKLPDVMSEISDHVRELYERKQILDYEINDGNVLLRFRSGIPYLYSTSVEGTDGEGEELSLSVITCQPYEGTYPGWLDPYLELPDQTAEKLDGVFNNCSFSSETDYDGEEVTLSLIRSFSSDEIILWHGNGDYSAEHHSILGTGEMFDWIHHFGDAVRGQIVWLSDGRAGITSKYIDEYCGDLSGSFFYLGTCKSGMDDVLANSFLNKGAAAVTANSDTIFTVYDLLMIQSVMNNMTILNQDTDNYHTLGEALELAKEQYGEDDRGYGIKESIAEVLIFGGEQAENYRIAEYEKVDEESLRKILSEYTSEPVLNFIYDDFDNNDSHEAIAFCGREDEVDGSYVGIFYLVTGNGVQAIRDFGGYWDTGKVYDFGTEKIFAVTQYFTTGGITFYYQIDGDTIREVDGSGIGDGLYQDEQGRMCMTDSQYDASVDGSGHTWNVYYFYWDDGLKEYGGTAITTDEFRQYNGADGILAQIAADGYEVTSIYQRKNGIININCCDGIWNKNVRVVYTDGNAEVSPITEGYFYEEGIIKPALNTEIATY